MDKKLYRSKRDNVISGVCGGLAEYLNLDATLIRLLWIIVALTGGIGFFAYIICMIIIPENPHFDNYSSKAETHDSMSTEEGEYGNSTSRSNNNTLLGIILVSVGGIILAKRYFHWFDLSTLWPLLLILAGVYIIVKKNTDR